MRSTLGVCETCPDLHTSFPHEPHALVTTPQAWFPGSPQETLPGLRSHPIHGNPKASPSGIYNSSRSRSILLVWDHLCHKQCCLVTQMASFLISLLRGLELENSPKVTFSYRKGKGLVNSSTSPERMSKQVTLWTPY